MTSAVVNNAIYALETPVEVESSGAQAWHCTRVNLIEFRYLWKIENFSFFDRQRVSPEFATKNINIKWQLHMSEDDEHLCLKLKKSTSCDNPSVPYHFKLKASILNADGNIGYTGNCCMDALSVAYSRLIYIDDLLDASRGLLPNDTLTLICDITIILDTIDIVPSNVSDIGSLNDGSHYEDFSMLLETGRFSDVTLLVDDKEFEAHKSILTIRSEVFAAMFDHEMMEENKSNRVVIKDFDHRVIQEMLTFIYSNKSPNLDDMAAELLAAADKYALKRLKIMCETVLHRDLNVDSAIETLILADRYDAVRLKAQSLNVIRANIATVVKTDEWRQMISNYPDLVTEIVSYIANK